MRPLVAFAVSGFLSLSVVQPVSSPAHILEAPRMARPRLIAATASAYTCSPGETDSTPWVTASGMRCGGNVLAVSRDLLQTLPFGTKVRVRGQTYIVGDLMHARWTSRIDLPFRGRRAALEFGVMPVTVEVLP